MNPDTQSDDTQELAALAADGSLARSAETETARLAETWEAFGELLARTADPIDERKVLAGVRMRIARQRRHRLAAFSACAAGIFVAAIILFRNESAEWTGSGAVRSVPVAITAPTPVVVSPATIATTTEPSASAGMPADPWEKDWDADLEQLRSQVQYVRSSWHDEPNPVDFARRRLDQLQQDVDQNSL